jgi:hypothetical protein
MNKQTQEALKMAGYELDGVIADVEKFDGFDDVCLQTIKRVRSVIAETLATNKEFSLVQTAQEPYAWATEWEDGEWSISHSPNMGKQSIPLYPHSTPDSTHPHQWQELTNEDIARLILINEVDGTGDVGLARLVEHASRIKNHG